MTSSKSNYFTKAPPPNTNTLEIKVQFMDFGSGVLEKTFESPKDSKEINSEYSLEALTLKLKLQYFVCLMRRADSLEKTLMLRKIEGRRRRGRQRMRWLDGITNSMNMSLSNDSEGQGSLVCWSSWSHRVRHNLVAEQYVAHVYEMHSASLWICLWGEFVLMQ